MLRIDVSRLVGLRRERDALSAAASDAHARVCQARDEFERARQRLRQARGVGEDVFGQYGRVESTAAIARAEEAARRAESELADARAAAEIASERAAAASGLVNNCERVAREMGALK